MISASPWRFAIVLGCFLGAGLVVFPMLLLIIACAVVFGPGVRFVYSSAGLLVGAALNYAIGMWLGLGVLSKLGGRFDVTRSDSCSGASSCALSRAGVRIRTKNLWIVRIYIWREPEVDPRTPVRTRRCAPTPPLVSVGRVIAAS